MFALRLLKTHMLKLDELHLVARATTVASILCDGGSRMKGTANAWFDWWQECDKEVICPLAVYFQTMESVDVPNIETLAEEADRN